MPVISTLARFFKSSPARWVDPFAEEGGAAPSAERLVMDAHISGDLERALSRISGKSALAGAIRYALTRWNALLRYLADGRLEMSNNAAERAMRAPVLGRKNYLFCGSDAGGQRAACVYTIVETAKMCGVRKRLPTTAALVLQRYR